MERNDLGTYAQRYNVVTLVPTLFLPPHLDWKDRWSVKLGRRHTEDYADKWHYNDLMGRWIVQQGYMTNTPTEIWSVEPEPLFDALVSRLHVIDRYMFRYTRFDDEQDAVSDLMANLNSILRVYDADFDRVDRLWRFNGVRVMPGGAP